MKTKNCVDLSEIREPCYGLNLGKYCQVLIEQDKGCGTVACPFYKPKGCKDWVRIESNDGIYLIPFEEWKEYRCKREKTRRNRW